MRKLGKIKINIKEPTPTAAERLHQSQQAIRKQKGLPDPSHYKQMAAQKKAEIDAMKEEKQTELKPRNFVAKNAKTAGAGKHKDIKKMLKDIRGQKHKGKMEEEVEQIDELSKTTLSSYKTKADKNYADHNKEFSKAIKVRDTHLQKANIFSIRDRKPWPKEAGQAADKASYHLNQGDKRDKGLDAAEKRLNREEVEQLDEMPESSMKTRDVHAHLKSKGWSVARTSGGHDIYKHPKAKNVIAVPRHKQLKAPLIKGILKSSHVSEEVMKEAIKLGGTGGRGNIYQYDRNPPAKDGSELENVPFHAKTEPQKKLQNALNDLGKKMKETHPKLKEDIGGPITIVKKGTNIKQKISPNSYATFKHHGFRKEEKDSHEYDYEGEMALNQLDTIMRHAEYLKDMIKPNTNLPEWVQAKITLAADYIQTSCDYLTSEMKEEVERIDELSNKTLHSYVHKATPQSHLRTKGINKALTKSMYKSMAPKPKMVKEDIPTNRPQPNLPAVSSDQVVASTQNAVQREKNNLALKKAQDKTSSYETQQRQNNTPIVNRNGSMSMKKESMEDPSEGEMKGKQGMSRRAQIVKDAAKGKKSDNPDKFQKDPELSSEIHKT